MSSSAAARALDSDGDQIRAGVEYMVSSFDWNPDSDGLSLDSTGNVVQPTTPSRPLPMTFHPVEGHLVNLSSDVNIKFNVSAGVWKMVHDESIGRGVVSTGGEGDHSWFRIEPTGLVNFYYLTYCRDSCQILGIDMERRLVEHREGDEFQAYVFGIIKASLFPSTL